MTAARYRGQLVGLLAHHPAALEVLEHPLQQPGIAEQLQRLPLLGLVQRGDRPWPRSLRGLADLDIGQLLHPQQHLGEILLDHLLGDPQLRRRLLDEGRPLPRRVQVEGVDVEPLSALPARPAGSPGAGRSWCCARAPAPATAASPRAPLDHHLLARSLCRHLVPGSRRLRRGHRRLRWRRREGSERWGGAGSSFAASPGCLRGVRRVEPAPTRCAAAGTTVAGPLAGAQPHRLAQHRSDAPLGAVSGFSTRNDVGVLPLGEEHPVRVDPRRPPAGSPAAPPPGRRQGRGHRRSAPARPRAGATPPGGPR